MTIAEERSYSIQCNFCSRGVINHSSLVFPNWVVIQPRNHGKTSADAPRALHACPICWEGYDKVARFVRDASFAVMQDEAVLS